MGDFTAGQIEMVKDIIEKIKTAERVLVGLGEELDTLKEVKATAQYKNITENIPEPQMLPFAEKIMIDEIKSEKCEAYKILAGCLKEKDYFVVSLCQDGCIRESGLELQRIVEPCGGYEKLQCSERCSDELYDVTEEMLSPARKLAGDKQPGSAWKSEWAAPVCPYCGCPLVFNNVSALNYVEEGYLNQWLAYKKWLQRTVNRKVVILELGVGLKYPTVIRWPFEKILYYNQKAELFRVHSKLYQIPEEVKERAFGICEPPEEFLKELSENF
ncbi:MAG: hypothetical protein NC400_13415 [Clostridium sp.]|nr:hypothetical protein [Clostridium sp.]